MDARGAVERYFEAWNSGDPAAVVRSMAPGGTYEDPNTGGPIGGSALAGYVGGLLAAFPDIRFSPGTVVEDGDRIAATWTMTGTNTGPMRGMPPTGRPVKLAGMDMITADAEGVHTVEGFFDGGVIPRQLGMQIAVQPPNMGPVSFGTAVHVASPNAAAPGAISVTSLHVLDAGEVAETQERSRVIARELAGMDGFMGFIGVTLGTRLLTISAWRDADAPRQLMQGGAHAEAADRFWGPGFGAGGATGVWSAERMNAAWVRCPDCGAMAVRTDAGTCRCGGSLPAALPFM
ncbi:MAG: ester cyclase [Thermoleophilia bacterium]